MDFMRGGELYTHLKRNKKFDEKRAKFYALIVALALGYLHENNIIYRDLKPENVLMDQDGYVYLTDIGLDELI